MGEPQRSGRLVRAARSLGVPADQLTDAACRFVGVPAPSDPVARDLLARLANRLDTVEVGILATINDLHDAATTRPMTAAEQVPPVPDPAWAVVAFADVMLSRLDPAGLRAAAEGFGLTRGQLRFGAHLTAASRADGLGTPGRADAEPYPDGNAFDGMRERWTWETMVVDAVAHTGSGEYPPQVVDALRMALRVHLADIGDAILRASEWQPTRLAWRHDPAGMLAHRPVPGAPHPLEAHVTPSRWRPDPDDPRDPQPLLGPATYRRAPFAWEVGWRDPDGVFGRHSGQTEASIEAARFAAEATIDALVHHAATARLPLTGRLLVPRTDGVRNLDARLVDLLDLLVATVNADRGDRGDPAGAPRWAMQPHTTPDHRLGSIVAALFDHLGLAWPARGDPACHAPVDSAEFTAFLHTQAVTLTPLARTYLAGLADAGPGERTLAERHAAGIRAVACQQPPGGDQLTLELGPAACTISYRDLETVTAVERFLAQMH